MRLTRRDISVLRDLALSHVLSRDQLIALGYFGSVTRVNTRLRDLTSQGFVKRLDTPFYGQSLYMASKAASEAIGERVGPLLLGRAASPRFIQHALNTTNVRIALTVRSEGTWKFEQQLWRKVGKHEVRPDGLLMAKAPIFIEVDMGHVSISKFKEKITAYRALALSGDCAKLYGFDSFRVLTITTGELRARHLRRALIEGSGFEFLTQTFSDIRVAPISAWS